MCHTLRFKTKKKNIVNAHNTKNNSSSSFYHQHHHHLSLNREGLWGTTDDFATIFPHLSLFSTALWDLANSRPVQTFILHHEMPAGYYWINPNGGGISDAIRVFCKMKGEKTQTCLESTTHEVSHITASLASSASLICQSVGV